MQAGTCLLCAWYCGVLWRGVFLRPIAARLSKCPPFFWTVMSTSMNPTDPRGGEFLKAGTNPYSCLHGGLFSRRKNTTSLSAFKASPQTPTAPLWQFQILYLRSWFTCKKSRWLYHAPVPASAADASYNLCTRYLYVYWTHLLIWASKTFIKPPLAIARAALRDGAVRLFVSFVRLFVCRQNA